MGRILSGIKAAADEMERLADNAERATGATGAFSSGGNITYVFNDNAGNGRIGSGGTYGAGAFKRSGTDDGFTNFLLAKGVTAKYQLENSAFIAVLRAEFERLLKDGAGLQYRKLGMS